MSDSKKRRRGLGKGLSALLPHGDEVVEEELADSETAEDSREFAYLSVEKIYPAKDQPRKKFDEELLSELASSIKQSGLIQPLVVRQLGDNYELIAGERRWRACQKAGLREVPVVIKELSNEVAFTVALVENLQREDLSPLEEASAFQRLIDEFGYTQQKVSDAVGKSRSAVANSLRLLRLPEKIKTYVDEHKLTAGHARTLVTLPPEHAEELAEIVVKHGYNVREAEELARQYVSRRDAAGEDDDVELVQPLADKPVVSSDEAIETTPTSVVGVVEPPTAPHSSEHSHDTEEVAPTTQLHDSPPDSDTSKPTTRPTSRRTHDAPELSETTEENDELEVERVRLEGILGTKVAIAKDKDGCGRIELYYSGVEELRALIVRLAG